MRKRTRRTRGARWLVALLAAAFLVCGLAPARAWAANGAVYVSADGSDDNSGTREQPYATLAKAVDAAEDGDTVYVMSDLTMTESARFWNKHLTIASDGGTFTVTRSSEFEPTSDLARGTYNGAMIEVGGSSYNLE